MKTDCNERLRWSTPSSAFECLTDLSLALLRGQACPINVGLEAFELSIPPGLVLSPFPLDEGSESLF